MKYRRCSALSKAINVAYDFKRSHFGVNNPGRKYNFRRQEFDTRQNIIDCRPEPMEIDHVQVFLERSVFSVIYVSTVKRQVIDSLSAPQYQRHVKYYGQERVLA